ncbi:MAG: helix-turn-helix domain-containing protein [Burkholderiales bacterium]|nr:helix-turn-helix domain-containing protein [Burkholderiales bacterium]
MGALDIDAVTSHYQALAKLVPLKAITRENDYRKAVAALEALLDAGGADERHPLAGLVEALGEVIESYEARAHKLPASTPNEALAFLMEQHGLKQADLTNLAPQSTISAVLAGKRAISKQLAIKLAARFGVSTAVFV